MSSTSEKTKEIEIPHIETSHSLSNLSNLSSLSNLAETPKTSNSYFDRPTFYYENDKTKPIRAGGVIIYKKVGNDIKLLMIKTTHRNVTRYEDIGGKTDINDITEYDTVSREVAEETNLVINQKIIKYQLKNADSIYVPYSKYLVFLVEANLYERNLKSTYFGDKEIQDNIYRTINWISLDSYLNNTLNFNPRITSDHIKELIKNKFTVSSQTL